MPNGLDLGLFTAGFVSWVVSTLAAGGGSVLIVAAVANLVGGRWPYDSLAAAPFSRRPFLRVIWRSCEVRRVAAAWSVRCVMKMQIR
jgi:hypothetical protein